MESTQCYRLESQRAQGASFICGWTQYSFGVGIALAIYSRVLLVVTLMYCGIRSPFPPAAIAPWVAIHLVMREQIPRWLELKSSWAISFPGAVAAVFVLVFYVQAFKLGVALKKSGYRD